jgi:hypothetical protein
MTMAEKDKTEEIMHVEEDKDGTATVELPDTVEFAQGGEVSESRQADDGDVDHPDDSEAVRAARRARRRSKKDLIRKTNEEKDVRLSMLQRQNEELMNRLSNVERKTQQHDMGRLDKAIEDQGVRLEYAKMKLSEATANGNGDEAVQAQEMLYEARKHLEQLTGAKQQANRPAAPQQKAIDPGVQRHAATWIERNEWYKPDLSDTDSKVAKQVDETLVADGWNPGTAEYWDELDSRLQKYLPHRYNRAERGESRSAPRNVVGSSGREASAAFGGTNRTFTLSAEQVRAMKDAGMWEDPAKRARMVKRYATESRNNRGY